MNAYILMGTRPEAIKLAPVIKCFGESTNYKINVISTGQHENLDSVLELFNISINHKLTNFSKDRNLNSILVETISSLNHYIQSSDQGFLMIQGDTTSALAGALTAFNLKFPLIHLEAGLRTYDSNNPFPEELNRQLIARIANLHLAPTTQAKENLVRESIDPSNIFVVGNTVIDAARIISESSSKNNFVYNHFFGVENSYLLVPLHRRESWGSQITEVIQGISDALQEIPDARAIFVMHPNPALQEYIQYLISTHDQFILIPPLLYDQFVAVIKNCWGIITDSGGLQEEAAYFHKPLLIARKRTERMEGVEAGIAKLIGTDRIGVRDSILKNLYSPQKYEEMMTGRNPYGDGYSSERIVEILNQFLGR